MSLYEKGRSMPYLVDRVRCFQAMVPMRDGVRLNTFVFLPENGGPRYPVILHRTPYGITSPEGKHITDPTKGWLPNPQDPLRGSILRGWREIVRRGLRGLHVICVPVGGLQPDILIGAGCVASIETSAVTLGEFGIAPRFSAAVRAGTLRVLDATCPAIHAALQAGEKGLPFIPLRGLLGSDLVVHRADWKVIDNPFQTGDPIVLLPAIRPDFALFHAPLADRFGNVFIGRWRELLTMAHAPSTSR